VIRLTGGQARGRVLREPVPRGVRPTSSRVREALFSMVGQDLRETTFLDAFGGAGVVGLEAWSRGARVVVVEQQPEVARAIVRRGEEVAAEWTVRTGDVLRLAPQLGVFEGVFVDPPYAVDPAEVLPSLAPLATGWLILEAHASREDVPAPPGMVLDRVRRYGKRALWVFTPTDSS